MKLTDYQERIYVSHVALLKKCAKPAYSENAVRELDHSYLLYCQLKDKDIPSHECTKEEAWQELASLPIEDDIIADMVEEIEGKLRYQRGNYNRIMGSIIQLQIALGVPVKEKYYAIFLEFFNEFYLQVISKRYLDRYRKESCKTKSMIVSRNE